MRILLIAYEFPPSPSPQSLRWAYLSRELVAAGHEVWVLTVASRGAMDGLPALPEGLRIERVSGGPVDALVSWLARLRRRGALAPAGKGEGPATSAEPGGEGEGPVAVPARLNWKGRLMDRTKRLLALVLFPDVRGEWRHPAKRAGRRILAEFQPDMVISSHEPATTLEVGLYLRRFARFRWVVDLGDPVLADYTPMRWRMRSLDLERRSVRKADATVVTTPVAADLLRWRHGRDGRLAGRIHVVSQGFDDRDAPPEDTGGIVFDADRLELLFTGTFYAFRRPDALLDAVEALEGVRLNIATVVVPPWLAPRLEQLGDRVRVLGFLPHRLALSVQRRADVLVNIANQNPCQVPGKIYEYLGSGRPILHIGACDGRDESAALVERLRRGWACPADADSIRARLGGLRDDAGNKRVGAGLDLRPEQVGGFGWSRVAGRFMELAGIGDARTPGHAGPTAAAGRVVHGQ